MSKQAKIIKYIHQLINILIDECKILKEGKWYNNQREWHVKQGFYQLESGILIPKNTMDYQVLYETYHINLLEEFILFLKEVIKYRKTPIVNFSLRSLWEISFIRIDVHFSKNVDGRKEKKCRLLNVLSNYAVTNIPWFKKLFQSEKYVLNKNEINIINNYLRLPIFQQEKKKYDFVKELRRRINSAYNDVHSQVISDPFLNKLNSTIIPSHLSHFLHGDPFSVKGLLETPEEEQEKRTFALAVKAGVNAVNRVGKFINNVKIMEKIRNINDDFDNIWKIMLTI